jgi:hypothetical protein
MVCMSILKHDIFKERIIWESKYNKINKVTNKNNNKINKITIIINKITNNNNNIIKIKNNNK